jgi:tetratricopeptide (TPR) repeat protein
MAVTHRVVVALSLVVFLIAAAVYLITLTPTVPFWDSGEFIAVSNILGIPHPPGTPFYVLIGRIATMVPWATIAQRVNALSAISSALAILLTFLTSLKLIHLAQGKERSQSDEWIAIAGAAAGALLLAFSDSFWENSIEAEVYSMMSLAQILVLWLGLNWWESHEERPTAGPLLLCVYVMWLCVGLHLGVAIMGLPLMALVALVDRRAALVFAMPFLSSLFVTMGLERMAGAVLGLSTATFFAYAWQKKIGGWVVIASGVAALIGMSVAFGDKDFTAGTALIAAAAILVPLVLLARKTREGKILALALGLMVVGYSTHLYLPIRAAQHPAINEGNPATWNNLKDLLERKQYGSSSMFVRRGGPNWPAIQLDKEFWRYFKRQWLLFGDEHAGDGWANGTAKGLAAFLAMLAYLIPPGALLPLAFGLIGGFWQARRNAVSFWMTFVFVGLTTAGMIVFLNFSDHEVRERDYFFQSGYHAYALWIALGCAWFITWVRDSFAEGPSRRWAAIACGALVLAQPLLELRNFWFTHDRRGNYVAHDYAYNMLAPLAKDSFVYTNGDNDTFPLWYMQQVENFRKDVRVVNLSLLNTDWYIYQLRDEAPTVPITLDNATINALGAGIIQDQNGNVIYTNRYMVEHIIREDRTPSGWKKQPYFAVTVPEHMDLDKNFTLEGLVYRVNPDTLGPEVDELATRKAMYQTFLYRGLFRSDGTWDSTVYKDENASTLSRNYAAAHLQLGFWYQRRGESKKAITEFERVERMFPGYADVGVPLGRIYLEAGDTAKAVALFEKLMRTSPGSPDVHYYYGVTQMFRGNGRAALQGFDRAIDLDPEFFYAYLAAYSMLDENGQPQEAAKYLEKWLSRHPDDRQVRALLEGGRPSEPPKPGGMIQGPPPQVP